MIVKDATYYLTFINFIIIVNAGINLIIIKILGVRKYFIHVNVINYFNFMIFNLLSYNYFSY